MIELVIPPKVDVMGVENTRRREGRKATVSILCKEIRTECHETAFV
jgi:hypothetical protein